MKIKSFKKIFEPKSIAVIGVSTKNPFHPANVIYSKNKLRYPTRTYCVNPSGGTFYGDTIYKTIKEIPEKIDLAILAVKASIVPVVMQECIDSDVGGAIVISGGFTESGRDDLQNNIIELSKENDFPFIGPNCLGVFSSPHVDSFFLPGERLITLKEGSVSVVSQSGGILVDQLIKLTQEGVGIARAVSIGNKAVIDEVSMIQYLKDDDKTKVIGLYLEGFSEGRGRDFINEINEIEKPVILLKSGKTPGGSRAVTSHTAAIAGDYFVFNQLIQESQAIEAANEAEFAAFCEALSAFPKKTYLNNVCIITASGGHGALTSDGCYNSNINTPEIPKSDQETLQTLLSPSIGDIASFGNPIDLTGSAVDEDFYMATRFFLEKDYIDGIILLLLPYLPGITTDIGARIGLLAKEYNKPLIAYIPHVDKYGIFIEGFESNGIPVSHSVEGTVHMARALRRRDQ